MDTAADFPVREPPRGHPASVEQRARNNLWHLFRLRSKQEDPEGNKVTLHCECCDDDEIPPTREAWMYHFQIKPEAHEGMTTEDMLAEFDRLRKGVSKIFQPSINEDMSDSNEDMSDSDESDSDDSIITLIGREEVAAATAAAAAAAGDETANLSSSVAAIDIAPNGPVTRSRSRAARHAVFRRQEKLERQAYVALSDRLSTAVCGYCIQPLRNSFDAFKAHVEADPQHHADWLKVGLEKAFAHMVHSTWVIPWERKLGTADLSPMYLTREIKGIYVGLLTIEKRCLEINKGHHEMMMADPTWRPSDEEWEYAVVEHRTLLHEFHDFYLASQHHQAPPRVQQLAAQYGVARRIWTVCNWMFLENLKTCLPASREHYLHFVNLSYAMLALLYETLPAFREVWVECLAVLARARTIGEEDAEVRNHWESVCNRWSEMELDYHPARAVVYYTLARTSGPDALYQLYNFAKAVGVPDTNPKVRAGFKTWLQKSLKDTPSEDHNCPLHLTFIKVHASLYPDDPYDQPNQVADEYAGQLKTYIRRLGGNWRLDGTLTAICFHAMLLEYGDEENQLFKAITQRKIEIDYYGTEFVFETGLRLWSRSVREVLTLDQEANSAPFLHTTMVFIAWVAKHPEAMSLIEKYIPWKPMVLMLNRFLVNPDVTVSTSFPELEMPHPFMPAPLPEDWALRGLDYGDDYLPARWFVDRRPEAKLTRSSAEYPAFERRRKCRMVYLGTKIAGLGRWMVFLPRACRFVYNPQFEESGLW